MLWGVNHKIVGSRPIVSVGLLLWLCLSILYLLSIYPPLPFIHSQQATTFFKKKQSEQWDQPMARASIGSATPISSSFHRLKKLSNSSPPLHVTFRRHLNTSCATTMSDGKAPHPSLQVTGGARHKFLSAFKSLHNPYSSYPIVDGNLHIEAIFAAFFRSVRLRRECLRTKDDGSVALDWVSGDDRSLPPDSPLLILLVGLASYHKWTLGITFL